MKNRNQENEQEPAYFICNISDCRWNKGAVCTKNVVQGSRECRQAACIPVSMIDDNQFRREFKEEDCVEITIGSSSKGAQKKWRTLDYQYFIKERFFYEMRFWNDDLVEIIASDIGKQLGFHCIPQYLGRINGRNCSYSEYWKDVKFVSFRKLDKLQRFEEYANAGDRVKYALDLIWQKTGLDYKEYFYQMTLLDMIVANEDRHLSNFGVLWDGREYRKAPLFDFGLGLFETGTEYRGRSLADARKLIVQKPFGIWLGALDYLQQIYEPTPFSGVIRIGDIIPNQLAGEYLNCIFTELGIDYENN